MTFISVIIPFNTEKRYLKDCLQSLAEEKLADMETIIILNGIRENENSINKLIKNYQTRLNIKLKTFDEDIGVAKARNEGLKIATWDYIYFIDGDDYVYKEGLNKLIAKAMKLVQIL